MYWLRAKVHPMWQVTALCLGVLLGVGTAQSYNHFSKVWWLVIALLLAAIAFYVGRRWALVLMLLAGGVSGLWRGSVVQQDISLYKEMYGKRVQLVGKVKEDADSNKRGELVLRIGELKAQGKQLAGELWVTTANRPGIMRSDTVTIDGKLMPGFGSFVGSMQRAEIVSLQRQEPGDIALAVRNDFSTHIEQAIEGAAARLGEGFLLGQKRGLPEELVDALKIAGLTHIVVASGYNLTILVRLSRRLFVKVSKFLALFSSLTLIGCFIAITGFSPSMTRAGMVSVLALWAWYYGRRFHPVTLLSLVGAATVVIQPSYVWGDLGWQLSFAAFAGVMIVAPLVHAYFYGNDKPSWFVQVLIETISAQAATLPIILFTFGQMSNVSPLANVLIVPFVPFAMLLVFVAGVGAYILPHYATIIAWPAQVLLDTMIAIVNWCASLSWAQVAVTIDTWGVLIWYLLLGAVCLYVWRVTKYQFHRSSIVE